MTGPVSGLPELLRTLQPVLHRGVYVFCVLPQVPDTGFDDFVAMFREAEGVTVIAEESKARRHGWRVLVRAAWLTLSVHSDLEAVGLTAAVAAALANAGISCNVVAAGHHDHLFVPIESGQRALDELLALKARHAATA